MKSLNPDKSFIVNSAPIFANLKDSEKDLIIQKSKVVEFKKGDIIYRRLDAPDALYCVITGRVRIFNVIAKEKDVLEYLHCGNYFGIISLLTGEPHSVNAEAANDSKILRIEKEDFQEILNKVPQLAIDLSKTLSRRLRRKDLQEKRIFESSIISVFSAVSGIGRTMYAANLALSLRKETHREVILVGVGGLPLGEVGSRIVKIAGLFPIDSAVKEAIIKERSCGMGILNIQYDDNIDSVYIAGLNALLTHLTANFHYIIVDLPAAMNEAVFQALTQSDMIHIITDSLSDNLTKTKTLIAELYSKVRYPQEKIKVILNAKRQNLPFSCEEISKFLNNQIYANLPLAKTEKFPGKIVWDEPDGEYAKTVRRIAREAGDVRMGLALSGGAALGLAHIGVLKVLEKENIPVDVVAGSSMGALIAALWAAGLDSAEIEKIALKYNNNKKEVFRLMVDPCFPKLSFFKGRGIRNLLKKHIGNKTFQDLKFPLKIVALNLSKRQKVVFDSGKLIDAVMASIAIPGAYAPLKTGEDLLIDGGAIEPVPVGTLVKMGIKKIIAVNVLPSPENIIQTYELKKRSMDEERKQAETKGCVAKIVYFMYRRLHKMFFPNVLDVIINSIQTMEYVIAEADSERADVILRPVAVGVDWFELFKAEALIKKGEEETQAVLSAIKSLSYD